MKLSYETLLSPTPIKLSVGTIRKPTLREISELTFNEFDAFKFFLKLTPKRYYKTILNAEDKWDSMSDDEKSNITLYKCIMESKQLQETYSLLLNFFFIEDVIYDDGIFIITNDVNDKSKICGALFAERFDIILLYLQQICMIYEEPKKEEAPILKNSLARKLYEKIQKAEEEKKAREDQKMASKLALGNIISSVSNYHKTINPINVWDLTLFQLYDTFKRMQINDSYEMNKTSVSVYGDEKKKFDPTLWYEDINKENQDVQ